ncbi:MAG TPA: D-glycerate dehydrogenase, partial [Caldithrix sp.]|nr:D-glycerate dehydrogenase [Caldithrix sp.]
MKTVLITKQIPQAGIDLLSEKGYQVIVGDEDFSLAETSSISGLKNIDALITLLSDPVDKKMIDSTPNLKIIANYAVGYNNIDIDYAASKGIFVTNTPDVLTNATADLTWALILAVSKRIVESDQFMRNRLFTGWQPMLMLGGDVTGKTLGIIGAGRIGQAVARRAKGFEMNILYSGRSRKEKFEKETGAKKVTLEELLKQSDFISLHCPLTPETRHLINRNNISLMKKSAYLINTSRGPVVEEEALTMALKEKNITGAGLD